MGFNTILISAGVTSMIGMAAVVVNYRTNLINHNVLL